MSYWRSTSSLSPLLEARMTILRKKAKAENLDIPNEVLRYIAYQDSITQQDLEKALIRVVAYSSFMNRDIDVALAREALEEILPRKKSPLFPKHDLTAKYLYPKRPILPSAKAMIALVSSIALMGGCSSSVKEAASVSVAKVQTEEKVKVVKPEETKPSEANTAESKPASFGQEITLSGRTEPFQQNLLSPAVAGNVKEIYVDLGSYVKKGEKLAQLDESDLAPRIQQAEAQVRTVEIQAQMRAIEQQIQLNQMKVDLSTDASIDAEREKFEVQNAETALDEAKKQLEKTQFLYDQGGVSKEELEQAQKRLSQAEIQLSNVKKQLTINKQKLKEQQESAQAVAKLQKESLGASAKLTKMGVEQAKADLEIIRYQYNNLAINAPISGFITDKNAIIGESVAPGTPVFVITNLDKLYITIYVPEAMINRVKPDQSATVTLPTLGKSVEGKVTSVAQLMDLKAQGYPVKVLIENADHDIKGGMRAQVSIHAKP